ELLQLPKELGEFAIVHELVHLLVPNHGKVFKMFMFAYLPDWEERELKLQSLIRGSSSS
ncbi:MAG: M48 family metallopeptidase, partial [Pseudanabaena sp.]